MSERSPVRVAVCASGKGSNAEALIQYAQQRPDPAYQIVLVVASRAQAGVVQVAARHSVPCEVLHAAASDEAGNAQQLLRSFEQYQVELVCLAGFMRKVPQAVVQRFEGRILNIHPALLPKYGGHGMYGEHVFRAVLENDEEQSGVSVHLVDAEYDRGLILAQESFALESTETLESLAQKTHQLEHQLYPKVLETLALREREQNELRKKRNTEEIL